MDRGHTGSQASVAVVAVDSGPDAGAGRGRSTCSCCCSAGAAAIIAGLTTLLPAWAIVVGIVVFALGGAAPLRTFWRRRRGRGDHAADDGRVRR